MVSKRAAFEVGNSFDRSDCFAFTSLMLLIVAVSVVTPGVVGALLGVTLFSMSHGMTGVALQSFEL